MIFILSYLSKQDVAAFLALDKKVYSSKYQVSKEATLKRLSVNPFTDIIVKKNNDLVGYISLCPVEESLIKQIANKETSEETIEKNILPYNHVGYYDAYLSSIVVDKEKFPKFSGRFLFICLQNHIRSLRKRGVFIKNIIAVAVSSAGRRTLEKMRFREINKNVFLFDCLKNVSLFISERVLYRIFDSLKIFIGKIKLRGSV